MSQEQSSVELLNRRESFTNSVEHIDNEGQLPRLDNTSPESRIAGPSGVTVREPLIAAPGGVTAPESLIAAPGGVTNQPQTNLPPQVGQPPNVNLLVRYRQCCVEGAI